MNTSDPTEDKPLTEPTAQPTLERVEADQSTPETPAKPQPRVLDSLGALLTDIFGSDRPRTKLKQSEIAAIDRGPGLGMERSRHLEQAAADYTLDRTRQLMLFSMGFGSVGKSREVAEFLLEVLKGHPAFQAGPVAEYLSDPSSSPTSALRKLASQDYSSILGIADAVPLKKPQLQRCKANAMQCLLLLPWLNGHGSLPELVESVRANLWRSHGIASANSPKIVTALFQSREPTGAIVYDLMKAASDSTRLQLESERADHQRTLRRTQEAESALANAKAAIHDLQSQVANLQNQLQTAKNDLVNSEVLSADRYASLRGRVLGKLRSESSLLSEGLLALRRDPPKVHVMIDHADRVIGSLKEEILRLEQK